MYVCTPYTSESGQKGSNLKDRKAGYTQRDKRVRDKRLESRIQPEHDQLGYQSMTKGRAYRVKSSGSAL